MIEANKKCLKRLIDIQLLIKSHSQEERRIIFGNFKHFEFHGIFTLIASDAHVLLIIMQSAWVIRNNYTPKAGSLAIQK